jgi:hypothetical protein|tara:strand:+ start:102 stop:227 length:126 start_codon:yes stop_codon:yes gene_type:complete
MKVEVEIKRNGHVLLNGEVIAVLAQWNRYEKIQELIKRKKK